MGSEILNFFEEKGRDLSFLKGDNKCKFELSIVLSIYLLILYLWHFTAWRVEWTWRLVQFAVPISLTLVFGRPLESVGLRVRNLRKEIKFGLVGGTLLSLALIPILLIWFQVNMPESISSKYELAYAFLLVLVNITSIEIFYRGYIQPRLEFLTMSIPGVIMTSLLAVLDFWELWVIQSPSILVVIGIVLGVIYMKTRSLISPLVAHLYFMMILMFGVLI